jgi:hypothetical protein
MDEANAESTGGKGCERRLTSSTTRAARLPKTKVPTIRLHWAEGKKRGDGRRRKSMPRRISINISIFQ